MTFFHLEQSQQSQREKSQQNEENNQEEEQQQENSQKVDNVEQLFENNSTVSKTSSQRKKKQNTQQNKTQTRIKNTYTSTQYLGYNKGESSHQIHNFYEKRKERKQADKDGEILANRIALLKQEEIRTLKKIEETRKKALEVYYLKLKNDDRQKKREELKNYRQDMQTKDRLNRQKMRQTRSQERAYDEEERIVYSKEEWLTVKRQNANQMKEQRRINEQKIMQNKNMTLKQAKDRKSQIQTLKQDGKMRRYEYGEQKKEIIRREIEDRAVVEDKQKSEKLGEIKRMENYEIELIQRLKSTQQMQSNAYEELESALMLSAPEFQGKYLESQQNQNQQQDDGQQQMDDQQQENQEGGENQEQNQEQEDQEENEQLNSNKQQTSEQNQNAEQQKQEQSAEEKPSNIAIQAEKQ